MHILFTNASDDCCDGGGDGAPLRDPNCRVDVDDGDGAAAGGVTVDGKRLSIDGEDYAPYWGSWCGCGRSWWCDNDGGYYYYCYCYYWHYCLNYYCCCCCSCYDDEDYADG